MNTADRDNTGESAGEGLADPFAALAESGMARGPRFDPPPPQPESNDLEHVLQGVENLSHGIDALLQAASISSIGAMPAPPQPARAHPPLTESSHGEAADGQGSPSAKAIRWDAHDSGMGATAMLEGDRVNDDGEDDIDNDDDNDDEEIMRVFDEDEPSDIHAIDRLLAQQAEELLGGELPGGAEGGAAEERFTGNESHADEPALAGARAQGGMAAVHAATAPAFAAHAAPVAHAASSRLAEAIDAGESSEESAVLAVIGEPVMPAHSGSTSPAGPRATGAHTPVEHASMLQNDMPAYSGAGGTTLHSAQAPGMPAASAPANAGMDAAHTHVSPATNHTAEDVQTPARRGGPLFAPVRMARGAVVEVLAMVNLPLCVVPASLKPTVNVLAVTLALWAPAVWWLAPRLAEYAAAASSAAASADPAHHQSALREASAAHAEDGGGSHGGH